MIITDFYFLKEVLHLGLTHKKLWICLLTIHIKYICEEVVRGVRGRVVLESLVSRQFGFESRQEFGFFHVMKLIKSPYNICSVVAT